MWSEHKLGYDHEWCFECSGHILLYVDILFGADMFRGMSCAVRVWCGDLIDTSVGAGCPAQYAVNSVMVEVVDVVLVAVVI